MSINRRNFLKQAGLGLAATAIAPHLFSCDQDDTGGSPFKNIGIQLFTLRELLDQDAKSVLKNIAKIGYKHVETFGLDPSYSNYWGLPIADFKSILADNGLKTYSGHYMLMNYLAKGNTEPENLEKYIEVAHELGQKYIVAPVTPMHDLNKLSASDYQYFAERLNIAGEMSKKAGIKIGYHNHFWEFKEFGNGTKGLDIMIAFTEPELVDFELDLFWTVKAGENPQSYFDKYPNRFSLWHIKDMDRNVSEPIQMNDFDSKSGKRDTIDLLDITKNIRYAEVGSGSIDFANIIRYSNESGLQYAFVEQDEIYSEDKYASIRKSYEYVKKNLAK